MSGGRGRAGWGKCHVQDYLLIYLIWEDLYITQLKVGHTKKNFRYNVVFRLQHLARVIPLIATIPSAAQDRQEPTFFN